MKKILALLLSLVMVFGLVACGNTNDGGESTPPATTPGADGEFDYSQLKIGVVMPEADHGFTGESIAHARAELEAQAAEKGFEYKIETQGEAADQIAAIENMLASLEPDVIILWPTEGDQLRNAAQTIVDAGVKLVIYDRLIEGFEGMSAEIMGDNETIGQWMGEYLVKYFADDDQVNYLRFIGDSSTVTSQRSGGMDGAIEEAGQTDKFNQMTSEFVTNWSASTAQEQMENWLNSASADEIASLDLIVTHDDEIVDGVTIALQNYYNNNPDSGLNVKLTTGVGARKETLATYDNTVANGIELVTYFFSPSFARNAIRLGIAAAAGEQYDGQDINGQLFLIPSKEVDKNNVDEFRASDEFAERYSVTLD